MLGVSSSSDDPRQKRLKHLVLWRTFSSLRRLLPAPLVAFILGDAANLPAVALAFALGPFALPIALWGPFSFSGWVWYVVLLVWTADMTYFLYYERPDVLEALQAIDRPRLPGRAVPATDGGAAAYDSPRDLVRHRLAVGPRENGRWIARWAGICLAVSLVVGAGTAFTTWAISGSTTGIEDALLIGYFLTAPASVLLTGLVAAGRVYQLTESLY